MQHPEMQGLDTGISAILDFCLTFLFKVDTYCAGTTPAQDTHAGACCCVLPGHGCLVCGQGLMCLQRQKEKAAHGDQFFFSFYVYFWERKTEHEQSKGRETGRHRIQSRVLALGCQHRARCRARTHTLWDRDLSRSQRLNRLSHPGALQFFW